MIKINVITSNTSGFRFIKSPNSYIDKKIKKLNLNNKNYKKKVIFCTLLLSNNREVKNLNKKFRKKDKTTDVLSFPFHDAKNLKNKLRKEKEIYLGDIIVNLNKVKAKENLKYFKLEFDRLWVHGLVHLFGHKHKKEKDFRAMNIVEKNYLKFIK